jgi:ATP-binding cassette subfamily F protein 3
VLSERRDAGEKRERVLDGGRAGRRRIAAAERVALAPLRRRIAAAEAAMARCSSEISRIDAALARPGLFDRDPGKAAALGKARALAAITLARAEEDWLEASAALESGSIAD